MLIDSGSRETGFCPRSPDVEKLSNQPSVESADRPDELGSPPPSRPLNGAAEVSVPCSV